MKKLLGIVVLGLFLSSNAYAGWFSKDKIKVDKCYDQSQYSDYNDLLREFPDHVWKWELDFKKSEAVRTASVNNQIDLDKFSIKIKTDEYVVVKGNTFGDFRFDLKNQVYTTTIGESKIRLKCRFK